MLKIQFLSLLMIAGVAALLLSISPSVAQLTPSAANSTERRDSDWAWPSDDVVAHAYIGGSEGYSPRGT